jgi:hypothetical protein
MIGDERGGRLIAFKSRLLCIRCTSDIGHTMPNRDEKGNEVHIGCPVPITDIIDKRLITPGALNPDPGG